MESSRGACAARRGTRQEAMSGAAASVKRGLKRAAGVMLDFALPPRCAGCAEVIDDVDGFCAACWSAVHWIGAGVCETCGIPLEATDAEECAGCLAAQAARPLDRIRAAVALLRGAANACTSPQIWSQDRAGPDHGAVHGAVARASVGRRIDHAGAPSPLAAVVARVQPVGAGGRRTWPSLALASLALRRVRSTPPLKGMSHGQRRAAVAGAFTVGPTHDLDGRTILLIDDVLTSGSTAEACAKALRKAGARRVERISWARVVRPARVMR